MMQLLTKRDATVGNNVTATRTQTGFELRRSGGSVGGLKKDPEAEAPSRRGGVEGARDGQGQLTARRQESREAEPGMKEGNLDGGRRSER